MSANDLLTLVTQLVFIFLGLLAAYNYLQFRDKPRRDIALMFGSLATLFAIQIFERLSGTQQGLPGMIGTLALLAQPYLLLRLARYYHPVPARWMHAAGIAMLIAWSMVPILPLLSANLSLLISLAVIGYFSLVDGYAMLVFIKGARTASGVVRQRLRLAAGGAGLLALALISLALAALLPTLASFFGMTGLLAVLVSGIAFYLSFAPPRVIRRAWQLEELRNFLVRISEQPPERQGDELHDLIELCSTANAAIGGFVSAVAQYDEAEGNWSLRFVSSTEKMGSTFRDEGIFKRGRQALKPFHISETDALSSEDHRLFELFDAPHVLAAPILDTQQYWGLLLVFLQHVPLFIQDDLDLLLLLSQQSAIALENTNRVAQLSIRSQRLTEQVRQQTQALEETRIEYQRIVEMAQEGIWETDTEFRTRFVNPRLAEMLGYTVEELTAKSVPDVLEVRPTPAQLEAWQQRQREGISQQTEVNFRRKDGSVIIALSSATPLFDQNGSYAGAVAMIADITERKQAEQEILKLNADLEQRVIERTAQLSNVNRELEAFSYSVSHDLRTPLRALDGFSQILLEDYTDKLDAEGIQYLQRIRAGSQRMGQLIDALLQLSRLTRVELQYETVNLSELARSIATELHELHPERQVEFRIQDNLIAKGDERMLRAALTNLFNNAWKFTGKQAYPCVEFGAGIHNNKYAYFIRDNGVGFDMSYAGKLFGAFQRLHGLNEFEGTGIGLATVERIFHRHRGEVWAEAAENQGATFYFTLNRQGINNGNQDSESTSG